MWVNLRANDPIFQYELEVVLEFFGLVDPTPRLAMEATHHGGIDVVDGLFLTKNGSGFSPAVSSEEMTVGSVWKIHVKSLGNNNWIFAGIIGASTTPSTSSYSQQTSYGEWIQPKV